MIDTCFAVLKIDTRGISAATSKELARISHGQILARSTITLQSNPFSFGELSYRNPLVEYMRYMIQ